MAAPSRRRDRTPPGFRLVVAAVVEDAAGRFLVSRRLPGSHLAGLWEFPGGGVERGETAEAALVRELAEELGIEIVVGSALTFAWHFEARKAILLLFYRARIVSGLPVGLQGQQIVWATVADLARLETPPADADLIRMLEGQSAERR